MNDINKVIISIDKAMKRIIDNYLKGDRTSVLLLGEPGIGKSEIVKQTAIELSKKLKKEFIELSFKWNSNGSIDYTNVYNEIIKVLKNPEKYFVFIVMRLSEREPTDLIGYPRQFELNYNGSKVKLSDYIPFIWQLVSSGCAGMLLLDDFTNITRPDTQSASYQITLDRMTGWIKFNKDFIVIATGNAPEHSSIASLLPTPQVSRLRIYNVSSANLDSWIEYMNNNYSKWDKRIYAFLKKNPEMFIKIPKELETLNPYPCPRTWTMLARISYNLEPEDLYIEASATVGNEAASMLKVFTEIKIPEIEELIIKPETWCELNFEQKLLTSIELSTYISENVNNKEKIIRLSPVLKYLYEYDKDMLMMILSVLRDNIRRKFLMICIDEKELKFIIDECTEIYKQVKMLENI